MTYRFVLSVGVSAAILAGCASAPQQPVQLASSKLSTSPTRIGVVMTPLPKVDTSWPGAGCLLCYATASMMNSALTKQVVTLEPEGLPQLKQDVATAIAKKGGTATVIPEDLKVDDLPSFSGSGPNFAPKDFSGLAKKYGVDKLIVLHVNLVGVERSYSAYVPTSDPKGVLRGVGYMVDLKTNAYDWYQPVNVLRSADGNWDEPPKFPGVTNAYFQALETGKDEFLAPFKQ